MGWEGREYVPENLEDLYSFIYSVLSIDVMPTNWRWLMLEVIKDFDKRLSELERSLSEPK